MKLTVDKATTANPGANWQAFADRGVDVVKLINNTGTTIEYRVNQGNPCQVLSGAESPWMFSIENGTKLEVRRVDQSNTQVDVQAHVYS